MSLVIDYPSYSRARQHLKDVLDSAAHGRTVTIARDGELAVVVPLERLRSYLFRTVPPRIRVLSEDGHVVALMEDRPFVSEGSDIDGTLADLAVSLREYAEDWDARLKDAPNHADAWGLVQLVKLSTDEQLRDWFEHGGE